MQTKTMEVPITQNDGQVTAANGTAAIMSDIYTFKVPRHCVVQLRPEDTLAAYLRDAGAEAVATDQWELVLRDPSGYASEVISSGIYTQIKEFQDRNKTKKIGTTKLIGSDWYIVLRVKATTVLVVSTCYFSLTCLRYVQTL